MNEKNKRGFTLVELIIVIAILGLLAAALFVAIDPAKRIGDARDAQRWSEVTSLLSAILNYTADAGALPTAIQALTIGQYFALSGSHGCTQVSDLPAEPATALRTNIVPAYIATLPTDPTYSGSTSTGYYILRSTGNRITVGACQTYTGEAAGNTNSTIEVTR